MFKKDKSSNSITKQQEFGLKLLTSVSSNLSKATQEAISLNDPDYGFKLYEVLYNLHFDSLCSLDELRTYFNFGYLENNSYE